MTSKKLLKSPRTKIMVFGTFDVLHPGHLHFFRQARRLAKHPFLIVSVARDKNVQKIKGCLPLRSEEQRLMTVKKCPLVDKAVLGSSRGYLSHILKERPQALALGYDQLAYTDNLKTKLKKRGMAAAVVRLKAHKPHVYKSSLLKKNMI